MNFFLELFFLFYHICSNLNSISLQLPIISSITLPKYQYCTPLITRHHEYLFSSLLLSNTIYKRLSFQKITPSSEITAFCFFLFFQLEHFYFTSTFFKTTYFNNTFSRSSSMIPRAVNPPSALYHTPGFSIIIRFPFL